jgi:hypothetical protein
VLEKRVGHRPLPANPLPRCLLARCLPRCLPANPVPRCPPAGAHCLRTACLPATSLTVGVLRANAVCQLLADLSEQGCECHGKHHHNNEHPVEVGGQHVELVGERQQHKRKLAALQRGGGVRWVQCGSWPVVNEGGGGMGNVQCCGRTLIQSHAAAADIC